MKIMKYETQCETKNSLEVFELRKKIMFREWYSEVGIFTMWQN